MNRSELVSHVRYSAWASGLLVEGAAALTEDQLRQNMNVSHTSVLDTLAHIYYADRVWLSRLEGAARTSLCDPGESVTIESLRKDWAPLLGRLENFVAGADPDRITDYKTLDGIALRTPVWQIVLHVVNHATLHRGQVMAMLRQLGIKPPATDLIFYYRSLQ